VHSTGNNNGNNNGRTITGEPKDHFSVAPAVFGRERKPLQHKKPGAVSRPGDDVFFQNALL
jgi:hypothetical protein